MVINTVGNVCISGLGVSCRVIGGLHNSPMHNIYCADRHCYIIHNYIYDYRKQGAPAPSGRKPGSQITNTNQ